MDTLQRFKERLDSYTDTSTKNFVSYNEYAVFIEAYSESCPSRKVTVSSTDFYKDFNFAYIKAMNAAKSSITFSDPQTSIRVCKRHTATVGSAVEPISIMWLQPNAVAALIKEHTK